MGYVDFDFGAARPIDRLAIWNVSLKDIKIHVSDTSVNSLQEVGSFALPNHLFFVTLAHDLVNFGATFNVRFLRIEVDSAHLFSPSDTFGFAIVGELAARAAPSAPPQLDGDYNADGTVDAADYVIWRKHLGTTFNMPNDTTPGSVDPEDYDQWRENFGATASCLGAGAAVPEPASSVLVAIGLSISLLTRQGCRAPLAGPNLVPNMISSVPSISHLFSYARPPANEQRHRDCA